MKLRRAAGTYTSWPFLKEEHIMISEMCKNFAGNINFIKVGLPSKFDAFCAQTRN